MQRQIEEEAAKGKGKYGQRSHEWKGKMQRQIEEKAVKGSGKIWPKISRMEKGNAEANRRGSCKGLRGDFGQNSHARAT